MWLVQERGQNRHDTLEFSAIARQLRPRNRGRADGNRRSVPGLGHPNQLSAVAGHQFGDPCLTVTEYLFDLTTHER